MRSPRQHVHVPDDGRGQRLVFVNGREIKKVFYADTKRGVVDAYREPLKLHKYRKRALTRRYRGHVTVVPC